MTETVVLPVYVLDSYALLAFFQGEPAGRHVAELLRRARQGELRLAMTVVNLGEVFYRTMRLQGASGAQDVLARVGEYGIELVDADRALALAAARIKGSHGMGYADCFVAALARRLGGRVVTGDPDFRRVEGMVPVEWLSTGG